MSEDCPPDCREDQTRPEDQADGVRGRDDQDPGPPDAAALAIEDGNRGGRVQHHGSQQDRRPRAGDCEIRQDQRS